jgi:hypothetical protein
MAVQVHILPDTGLATHIVRNVLIFGIAEVPNLVRLNALARQVAKDVVLVFQARFAQFAGELLNCVLGNASYPHGRPNRATIAEAANHGTALFFGELFHTRHYA